MAGHLSYPSKSTHVPAEDDRRWGQPTIPVDSGFRKRKATVVRPWLLLDSTGQSKEEKDGKHAIMRRTGLLARDLRILDPVLSYPSTVLGREKAIVINLEHIKAIITAKEVLLLNSRDPSVSPFVEELKRRLARNHHSTNAQNQNEGGKDEGKEGLQNQDGLKVLPFEFVALEACLEAACSCLENEARTLELEAHPALDKLTSKISTLNLECVRQIKSRLVAITGRVQKVRDELEHLLDDDKDMVEMYLTEKLVPQLLENSSTSYMNERDDMEDDEVIQSDMDDSAMSKHLDVKDLEMLLEVYFVQIDGTLNKLSTLREYVDDTEDYINIMLDDKQNRLLQMGVMMTTATLMVSAFVVVASIFGMNISIDLFDDKKAGMPEFLWTEGGGTAGTIFLYVVAAIAWCKHKRLLE